MKGLDSFISEFTALNCNTLRGYTAPHKPILLLSIIELFGEGYYSENRIKPDDVLVRKFETVWKKFISDDTPYSCIMSTPFFHMKSEPFWTLSPSEEFEFRTEYSLGQLRKSFSYASLDNNLFELLFDLDNRDRLFESIVGFYFESKKSIARETHKKMSFFDSLLQKRGLDSCPLPLWRLKITDDEYQELRSILERCTHTPGRFAFTQVRKEAALFFAEFWRREYVDGSHSKQMVYDALGSDSKFSDLPDYLYENACAGARALKIEQYSGARADYLNSMLYQGGLPMKLVTKNESYSVWDRFTRGLVNRRIDFEDLNLGIVATTSNSMKDYCKQLIEALERDRYMLMPFYCQNENDSWFVFLKELAKQERIRHRQLHPFTLGWEFRVDEIENKIYVKYDLKGLQKLPLEFIEEQRLNGIPFFSAQVRVNGKAADTFDYVNNFCRYSVVSKHPYAIGDEISLYLHDKDVALISDSIDIAVPYLLFMNKDGKYELGNQLGKSKSLLLIPEGWEVEESEKYTIASYQIGDRNIQGIALSVDFSGNIVVKGKDGAITFGENADLYWTDLISSPLYEPDIIDTVYDAQLCRYALCSDSGEVVKNIRSHDLQYRDKWQTEWKSEPSFGEIFARVKDASGHFVTPVRFINVGRDLIISLLSADKESCQIRVSWPYGHVSTDEGIRKNNDVWSISKSDCSDPRKIRFVFTPSVNSRNQFSLNIRAPFKDFSILGMDGNPIEDNAIIPYSDVDKFQYHLVGQDIKSFTFGNICRELKWFEDKLCVMELGRKIKQVPFEGSLLALFGTRETLRSMLERTSKSLLEASIDVSFVTADGHTLSFSIKDAPYRARQLEDGKIEIFDTNHHTIDFRGALKLFKIDEPDVAPVIMSYDSEKGYVLPEDIRNWGKTLLTGRTRGRILPALVNLAEITDKDYRIRNKEEAISTINDEIRNSTLGDNFWKRAIGWFNRVQKEDIPASSILELMCLSSNSKALVCLAFQLFAKCSCDEDKDTLMGQLKTMSDDLAFQWYWLCPFFDGLIMTITPFINDIYNPLIQELFVRWAMKQGDRMMELLNGLNTPAIYEASIGQCLMDELNEFQSWINQLCISSIRDEYGSHETKFVRELCENIVQNRNKLIRIIDDNDTYIETNQDNLEEEVVDFFKVYAEHGASGNEQWMFRRANAIAAHLKKEIDIFNVSPKVRRSIIFCSKSCHEKFLIAVNNKLAN